MHLKSLTVRGFKSFASATVFEFEPGLNAIVGPNGSGKSNLVDALTWVLGAQAASTLRGATMRDVIFAGGGARTALGRARVELVIDNTDGALPLPLPEISLARTMFSGGGSEYEINGESARLTDVQELLSDAGLGRELHSLVGQGQLDKILHGSALDRRELLEEAAGLVKYRKRQNKTAGRLEAMKANLSRLEDLASEVGEQLEGRREQADTARAATTVAARVRLLIADLLTLDGLALREQLERDAAAAARTERVQQEAHAKTQALGSALEKMEEEENRLKGERDALRALVARAESVKHRAESVALIAKERSQLPHISSTGHNESQLATAQATLSAELAEVQRLAAAHQGAESEVSTTKTLVQKKKEEAMSRGEELATFDAARKTHREEVTRLTGELAAARAGFDRAHKELDIRQAELAELEQLNGETDQETGAARAKVEKLCKAYEECQKAEATVREQRRTAATAEAKAQTLVHQLEIETESAAARQQALASAAEHDTPEPGSEAAHSEARAQGARELASLLKVADGWEGALSAALGHLSTAFVADDLCRPSIEVSALFQGAEPVAPASEQSKQLAQVLTEANVFSLTDLVTAPAPLIELLEQTLKPLAFCASTEQANHLATHYPRVTMVSRNGTVHTATSVIYPGSGKSTVEIFAELNRATEQLKEAQKQQKTATNRLAEAQERHRAARDKEKNCARSRGAAEAALAAATADLTRCEARQCTANAELQRLASRCATAKLSLAEAQTQLEGATQALDTANAQQPTGIREELLNLATGAQEAAAHAEQKLALAQAELTYLTQQLEAALNRKNQAEQTLKDLQQAQQQAEQQHHRQQERHRAATRTGTAAKALLTAIEGSLAKFHADVLSTEQKLATHRAEKMQLRDELAGAQRAYAAALTLRAESAEGRARIEARWEALDTRAQSELGKGIDTLLDTREDAPENEEPNTPLERSTLEAQLATAQKELKNLGVINPLALEEFEALKQRHDYLTAQIKDLKKSRADLRAVMKDVSAHIEQAFTETFTAVQGQFTEIFAELFPGGEGKLVLSDPADPQHSGIDLQVRPAGKKVTRMSLLSGGERSLASLALLLAVFMARPAPFYVLDEVEAALDDRNLGRLLGVLERLREVSQLIMVTHHQRTMGSADTIYGITMREGVSTVISQRSSDLDP